MVPVNQPNAIVQEYNDAFISTFDIHKPVYRNQLFRKYGKQGLGFFNTVETLGFKSPVTQTEWNHFEEDWIHATFTSRAGVVAPGAGLPALITLATTDLDASNNFYPRLFDDVIFSNQVTGTITAINVAAPGAPVITVEPHDATDDIGAIALGEEIVIYSNNFPEGTDQPDGRLSHTLKYTFNAKIIKETMNVTGTEMTNATWFNTLTPGGQSIPAYYMKGQLDADYRMMLALDGAALFDRPITNTTLSNAGHRTMQGLVPWIRSGGNIGTYTPGLYSIAMWNQMVRQLDKQFAPDEFLAMLGINLHLEWEDLFTDFMDDNPIIFAGGRGRESKTLHLGLKAFTKGERTFHLQRMKSFNHPKLYGAAGYNLSGMGIVTPLDMPKDPKTAKRMPSVGMRYKQLGAYSRQMETWVTGGAGPQKKTGTLDKMQLNMRCELGTEFFGSNRFFLIEEA